MGCSLSRSIAPLEEVENESVSHKTNSVIFRVMPSESEARKKFELEGSLQPNANEGHLTLRMMLDEPISQNCLGKFAAKIQVLDIFMCWVDIQEFRAIPTDSYRLSKAIHIYHKYIKEGALLQIGSTSTTDRERIDQAILLAKKSSENSLSSDFYDHIQRRCFLDMYHHIFLPFQSTPEFDSLTTVLRQRYNRVRVIDFEYFHKLGEGGFGFVVYCRKKSTGKHYAMKVQSKVGMLDCYREDPRKVCLEKDAFASLHHPFIVNLYYAFQTSALTLMVLDLAVAGDLHTCLANTELLRMSEDRVRFYMAEIVLALIHIHQAGLIYRDLKPQNILLNSDGHVQLVDLGGVMDDDGLWSAAHQYRQVLPLFAQRIGDRSMRTPMTTINEENETKKHNGNEDRSRRSQALGGLALGDLKVEEPIKEETLRQAAQEAEAAATAFVNDLNAGLSGDLVDRLSADPHAKEDILEHDDEDEEVQPEKAPSTQPSLVLESMEPSQPPAVPMPSPVNQSHLSSDLLKPKVASDQAPSSPNKSPTTSPVKNTQINSPEKPRKVRAKDGDARGGKRKQSIMGTLGYMAPEMVLMLKRPPMYGDTKEKRTATRERINRGYTNAVDWWSLGITTYKLLTGSRPFADKQIFAFIELTTSLQQVVGENIQFREYAMLFQRITFPDYVSPVTADFITRLLDANDKTRLGSGPRGWEEIKSHAFFAGIDWERLEQKQVEVPYTPEVIDSEPKSPASSDLHALLSVHGKEHFYKEPTPEQQHLFNTWDFISPHSLRIEAGLSHMMEQLLTNSKAQKIIGDVSGSDRY